MARVEDLMRKDVSVCREDDAMNEAARVMWERDCGFVPVIAGDGSGRLVGVITDRDLCMAAYTRGRPLSELRVSDGMSRDLHCCGPDDLVTSAESQMRTNRVRRLPVVDAAGQLLGVLSLADLARACARESTGRKRAVRAADLAEVLEAVSEPR